MEKRPEREKSLLLCGWLCGTAVFAWMRGYARHPVSQRLMETMPGKMAALRPGMSTDEILKTLGTEKARPEGGGGSEEHFKVYYALGDKYEPGRWFTIIKKAIRIPWK